MHDPIRQIAGIQIYPVPVVTKACAPYIMDTLDSSFTIEINGSPISNISDDSDQPAQAKIGSNAAVFTLKNGRLQCGDRFLGRSLTENRSMLPKQVLWFKSDTSPDKIHPVTAEPDGNSYKLKFAGAPLIEDDGAIFANLLGDGESRVVVKLQ